MTEKELKGFGKRDLIKIIIKNSEKSAENEEALNVAKVRTLELERELLCVKAELDRIKKEQEEKAEPTAPGTLADAALKISGFYEAADKAAAAYLERVMLLTRQMEKDGALSQKNAREKAEAVISDAQAEAERILSQAENEAKEKMRLADEYCRQVSDKVTEFYKAREVIEDICDKNGVKL